MNDLVPNGMIELNGRKIDLSKAFPLLTRDWKTLRKQGITADLLVARDVEALSGYAAFVLRKADAEFPVDDLDSMPFSRLVRLLRQMGEYEQTVDKIDPLPSTASTSSAASTGGTSPTSSS